ncbi:hypothetical protein BB560_001796 [Smittium megazygosporum]|uniref:Uncharacterized protein n=1 Tax=Smittium megazygosporum TaxID=133381 RepID=A0A2T9ZGK7_9FUNG|nr:hypothetical protein BB560_001796 [Smittium megazygosporum]
MISYKGIKSFLSKSGKSPSSPDYDSEGKDRKPSKKGLPSEVGFDSSEERKQLKLEKIFEKISSSSNFTEQEKAHLIRTLKTNHPSNQSSNLNNSAEKRFTPKLDVSSSQCKTMGYTTSPDQHSGIPHFNTFSAANGSGSTTLTEFFQVEDTKSSTAAQTQSQDSRYLDSQRSSFAVPIDSIPGFDFTSINSSDTFSNFTSNLATGPAEIQQFEAQMPFFNLNYRDQLGQNASDYDSEGYSSSAFIKIPQSFRTNSPMPSESSFSELYSFSKLALASGSEPSHSRAESFSAQTPVFENNIETIPNSINLENIPAPDLLNYYPMLKNEYLIPSVDKLPAFSSGLRADEKFVIRQKVYDESMIKLHASGIPSENARSRVETQIKINISVTDLNDSPLNLWSHILLPEILVSRSKFRYRFNQNILQQQPSPVSEQKVLRLEAKVLCASNISQEVRVCNSCIRREYKRSLRRRNYKNLKSSKNKQNANGFESNGLEPEISEDPKTFADFVDSPETNPAREKLGYESIRSIIFNCNDLQDFSSGSISVPVRITCYCRHHNEKVGYSILFSVHDYTGALIAQTVTPPIMITDDHKSSKPKESKFNFTGSDYERKSTQTKMKKDTHSSDGSKRLGKLSSLSPSLMALNSGAILFTENEDHPNLNRLARQSLYSPSTENLNFSSSYDANSLRELSLMNTNAFSSPGAGSLGSGFSGNINRVYYGTPNSQPQANDHPYSLGTDFSPSGNSTGTPATMLPSAGTTVLNLIKKFGPVTGGEIVKIFGVGFSPGCSVYFDSFPASKVVFHSETHMECVAPPATKSGFVLVYVVPPFMNLKDYKSQPHLNANINNSNFTYSYIERTDCELLELALFIISLRGFALNPEEQSSLNDQFIKSKKPIDEISDDRAWLESFENTEATCSFSRFDENSPNGQTLHSLLLKLRNSYFSRDLASIEGHLINILSMLISVGELDAYRLSFQDPVTLRSLLHFGSLLGMLKLTQFLISCGVFADSSDRSGFTSFHFSCLFDRFEITKFLLASGASYEAKTNSGLDGLNLALQNGYLDIVELITDAKKKAAAPELSNEFNNTNLSYMGLDYDPLLTNNQSSLPMNNQGQNAFENQKGLNNAAFSQPPTTNSQESYLTANDYHKMESSNYGSMNKFSLDNQGFLGGYSANTNSAVGNTHRKSISEADIIGYSNNFHLNISPNDGNFDPSIDKQILELFALSSSQPNSSTIEQTFLNSNNINKPQEGSSYIDPQIIYTDTNSMQKYS